MFKEYTDYAYYIHSCKAYVCSPEEQMRLWYAYREQGDMDARDRFIEAQLLWVAQLLCKHYRNSGCLMDLIQDANVQLTHLVDSFDPTKSKFRTYAAPILIKSAETNRSHYSRSVSVTINAIKVGKRLRDTRDRFLAEGMSDADAIDATARVFVETERSVSYDALSPSQRSAAIDCTVSLISLSNTDLSLDAPLTEDGDAAMTLAGQLGDDTYSPERNALETEEVAALRQAVGQLSERQRFVVIRTYGLFGYTSMRTVEIADALGVSRQRVNVILNGALQRLKLILADNV